MAPIVLPSNRPPNRFYRGGKKISIFRSEHAPPSEYEPEDWVASITCCSGQDTLGLTKLSNGNFLIDEIQNDAQHWLGPEHVENFGTSTKLLVKLLDAGQRLPIHAHPHRDWARKYINPNSSCGKAELWFVLEPGTVHLGLKETLDPDRLRALVDSQDISTFLPMMHEVRLEKYQAVYIPPGLLHAIGEGMVIAEVQEPSDLSVLCEWTGFAIDGSKDGHLGLGFDAALTAVERTSRTREEIEALITGKDDEGVLDGPQTAEYFRVERHKVKSESSFARGFAVIIAFQGELEMTTATDATLSLPSGSTVVIPYADGDFVLDGKGEVLIARPPLVPKL